MNKDIIAASIHKENNLWKLSHQNSELPIGNFEINDWLEDRKAFKHNHHLKQLMLDCGCDTTEGFIKITHAASINDSFWIKNEDENILWDDISFYRNSFNDTISKLAFEGLGLYGIQMSSTSPELTTDGSFRKCWRKEGGEICLYKRGISGAGNAGLEPYCETLASEIINAVDPESVRYSLVRLHRETATKCKAFTNEAVGFTPLRKLVERNITLEELLNFFDRLGCREEFQRMLVLDAVIFNVDRHLGNIGVLVENDTQKIIGLAPNFDFNLSMLPYVIKEEFDNIGSKLLDYGPRIGNDFIRTGQEMLTSAIRKELIQLQGFKFSFRGNKEFEPWRIYKMEEMVEQQIKALLKGDILYTKDVFVPQKTMQEVSSFDNTEEYKMASVLINRLKEMDKFTSVMEGIREDNHVYVIATLSDNEDFIDIIIQMDCMEIICEKNGIEMSPDEVCSDYAEFGGLYEQICRMADGLWNGENGRGSFYT